MLLTGVIPTDNQYRLPPLIDPSVEHAVGYVWTIAVTQLVQQQAIAPHTSTEASPEQEYAESWLETLDPCSSMVWAEYDYGPHVIVPVTTATVFAVPYAHLNHAIARHLQGHIIIDTNLHCGELWETLRTASPAAAAQHVRNLLAEHEGDCYGRVIAHAYTRALLAEPNESQQALSKDVAVEATRAATQYDDTVLVTRPVHWLWAGPNAKLVTRVTIHPDAIGTAIATQANAREYPLVWTGQPSGHTDDRQLQLIA